MATLKFDDNTTIEAAITSSERELVFAVQRFSECDAIVEQIRESGLKSLGDKPLTGKEVGAISAVTTADGVLLTVTLHDTEKQQAISDSRREWQDPRKMCRKISSRSSILQERGVIV